MNQFSKLQTRDIAIMAFLIALSAIGAQLKIQGTIAFDSMPAFVAALLFSPLVGALVGILGHLLTAVTSGFPMTLPIHLLIALMMGVTCFSFGFLAKKFNLVIAALVGFLLNGPITLFLAVYAMQLLGAQFSGMPLFMVLIIPLSIAAFLNILLALVIVPFLKKLPGINHA